MESARSQASVVWTGDLGRGAGEASLQSGTCASLPVTWGSRINRLKGASSPEELLAAAHASCYAMALAGVLSKGHTPPARLDIVASCTFGQIDGQYKVSRMDLEVKGSVPGLDQAGFQEAARQAELTCPMSSAIRGNVAINVKASLSDGLERQISG